MQFLQMFNEWQTEDFFGAIAVLGLSLIGFWVIGVWAAGAVKITIERIRNGRRR